MSKEVSDIEVHNGFGVGQLQTAFDKLTEGMDDCKMPINTHVHIGEWKLMIAACEFFTGSKLWQVKDLGLGMMHVKADGYYKTIVQLPDQTGA